MDFPNFLDIAANFSGSSISFERRISVNATSGDLVFDIASLSANMEMTEESFEFISEDSFSSLSCILYISCKICE